jgi:hypothetical protein
MKNTYKETKNFLRGGKAFKDIRYLIIQEEGDL